MSAIAQRRTAAAAVITILLAVLQYVLFAVSPFPARAVGPEPTYGTATVDGSISEWDLTADFFADLIKAGGQGGQTEVLGHAYLRYDCATNNLYVLALTEGAFDGLGEAWVKIYDFSQSELNGTEVVVYDGQVAIGFETVVAGVGEGQIDNIEVHFNNNGNTASNVKGGGSLLIQCPDETTTTTEGTTTTTEGTTTTTEGTTTTTEGTTTTTEGTTTTTEGTTTTTEGTTTTTEGTTTTTEGTTTTTEGTTTTTEGTTTTTDAALGALGDYVWVDSTSNCTQDDFELPVAGVQVDLFDNGVFVASTTTDANGGYLFENLEPSTTYQVQFTLVDTPEVDYSFTECSGNVPDDVDSDAVAEAGSNVGLTTFIDLEAGETDRTWDAGVVLTEVQGIQIESTTTTIEPVTVGTLPFTGLETKEALLLALVILASGGLLLLAVRRPDRTEAGEFSGWSNE